MNSETKQKIFTSAAKLFSEKGYTKVSVREICETAGVAKPALYYYFADKDALLEELVKESFVILEDLKTKHFNEKDLFMETFKALFRLYGEFADKYLIFTRFYMQMHFMAIPQKVKDLHVNNKEIQFRSMLLFFEAAKKEGYLRKNEDIEMAASVFLGSVNQLFLVNYFVGDQKYPLKEKLKQLRNYWIDNFMKNKSEQS